jgi:phosphate transport system substrate-binding protein
LNRKKLIALSIGAVAACATMAIPASAMATTITGAGSTLVAPIEAEWANAWGAKTGNSVTYSAVGSGTGIKDISSRLVDFGASDAPMTQTQAITCHSCWQIPWALSATGVGYNLHGVRKLRLSGPVIAGIYLGQITNWNDSRIARLNRGVHLPNLKITPVFRSDGSGDTYAFTNYLSAVNSTWSHRVGFATTVSFPTGVGGTGNSGVTAVLESTNGSIAYIAVSYLIAHSLPAAAIQNRAGKFEYPNLANIENAAKTVKHVPGNNELHIVNPPRSAKIAYPISTFTYAIVPASAPQGALLKQFITYAIGQGQSFGPALDFAPIPRVVLNAAKRTLGKIG